MKRSQKADAVDILAQQIRATVLQASEDAVREFRFHPVRRWRFDLALVPERVAIEVDGGVFVGGRHVRGAGREEDMRKDGAALELGWLVIHATPRLVKSGEALRWIEAAVRMRRERAA